MDTLEERIFLIGFMASGKSTIGRALAKQLAYKYIDTDEVIEKNTDLSINEIFEMYGEKYFRHLESLLVKELIKETKAVISVGGGLPCFNDNLSLLNQYGTTIFLKSGFNTSYLRLQSSNTRPLANQQNKKNLQNLYKKRLIIYNNAHFTVLSNRDIPLVIKRILTLIHK